MSVYNELRVAGQLCDAVIRVDTEDFYVHKLILCNCSPYFKVLFTHWSNPESRDFVISGVSADTMKLIIDFAYTGTVSVAAQDAQELLKAADQFNMLELIQTCCSVLKEHMSAQNCIRTWWSTNSYCPEFRNDTFNFLLDHFEEVATSEDFLLLNVDELVQIIERDRLNVKREYTVFRAILRWIDHAAEERRHCLPLLLSKVRLGCMWPDEQQSVINNQLVSSSEECQAVLHKAMDTTEDSLNYFSNDPHVKSRLPPAILLATGGWSDTLISDVQGFNSRNGKWVRLRQSKCYSVSYHGSACLDRSVYIIGGTHRWEQLDVVSRFDLVKRTWERRMPMHAKRSYVSVTLLNRHIYALGGFDGHNHLKSAEFYEPTINQWTLIAPMHEQRTDASCTNLHGKVYICGGFNGWEDLSSAECYDPDTNQWTLITPMSCRRSGLGVVAYTERIFAVGGTDRIGILNTVEAYDPLTNTWEAVSSMLSPHSHFGIGVLDDCLFVVGGFDGLDTIPYVEYYEAAVNEWEFCCNIEDGRRGLSCCMLSHHET